MKYANKILYIGTGLHLEPLHDFKETQDFVFIDTQPRSEFDNYTKYFNYAFYKKNFVRNVITLAKDLGFHLEMQYVLDPNYCYKLFTWKQYLYYCFNKLPEYINPTLLYFVNKNTKQTLRYYVSTNLDAIITNKFKNYYKDEKHPLKKDIQSSDGLIVSGYHPHRKLFEYFAGPIHFFGYTDTCYTIKEDELTNEDMDTIITVLENSICNLRYLIKSFYMVGYKTGEIVKCENFQDFKVKINAHISVDNNK